MKLYYMVVIHKHIIERSLFRSGSTVVIVFESKTPSSKQIYAQVK